MELSPHDHQVLTDLEQAVLDSDPAFARRLSSGRRAPSRHWLILALATASVLFTAGVAVAASFPRQGRLVGLGCILIVVGLSVAAACLPEAVHRGTATRRRARSS
ncbi:MAG: DUF3040 domain-containing protein [Candidatus Dormibacteraceae bacterium]